MADDLATTAVAAFQTVQATPGVAKPDAILEIGRAHV